jgi:type IV fimbrial biogenesis protein FimT
VLRGRNRGFTLIELGIGLAVLGILLSLALPAFRTFLQNTQIRNAAEATLAGLNLARTEAIRRNTSVRFQLVTSLTSSCALTSSSLNWVVSRGDATNLCDVAPAAQDDATAPTTADPKTIQKKSSQEGSPNVSLTTSGGSTLVFNGLGRVVGSGITQLEFRNPAGGTCEHIDITNGTMRCLRIMVSTGGQVKMCDPKVIDPTDPRRCA